MVSTSSAATISLVRLSFRKTGCDVTDLEHHELGLLLRGIVLEEEFTALIQADVH